MIETITLITLSVLFLIFFRPGKTPPLNNPLVIERPGRYRMTLAPQINLAQPFIETVAGLIDLSNESTQCSATQYFEVRDNQVTAHGYGCYLLAVTSRNGILLFQATSPQSDDPNSHQRTISEFAKVVLAQFPTNGIHKPELDKAICVAVQKAAQSRLIQAKQLLE